MPGAGIADTYLVCPGIVPSTGYTDFRAYEQAEWQAHSTCRANLAYVKSALKR